MSKLEKNLIALNLVVLSFFLTAALVIGPAGGNVPTGSLIISTSSSCPTGYSEYTSARGRYIVGTPASGTNGATTGTALTNSENRPSGAHTHGVPNSDGFSGAAGYNPSQCSGGCGSISTDSGGLVGGTNAPYIQHLYCQKL